jgi:hypothetical protein
MNGGNGLLNAGREERHGGPATGRWMVGRKPRRFSWYGLSHHTPDAPGLSHLLRSENRTLVYDSTKGRGNCYRRATPHGSIPELWRFVLLG